MLQKKDIGAEKEKGRVKKKVGKVGAQRAAPKLS